MGIVSMVKDDNTFRSYVINSFERVADLTEERFAMLNCYMNRINATKYSVQEFKEAFGLFDAGFITILDFVLDEENVEELVEFGKKFTDNNVKVPAK